jgi:hypothetical protein
MIGSRSRYNYANPIRRVGSTGELIEFERFDIRPTLTRIDFPDNTQYAPNASDNWSRIAWRLLGDGRLYWIIADCSRVIDPLSELGPITRTRFLTQLQTDLSSGTRNTITVVRSKDITKGMLLRIEDLDPGNLVSVDVSVLSVDDTTKTVTFSPINVAATIPAALSRVSRVYEQKRPLTVPSASRALFELLDFNNPLNTLVP